VSSVFGPVRTWLTKDTGNGEIFPAELGFDVIRRDRKGDTHGGVLIASKSEYGLTQVNVRFPSLMLPVIISASLLTFTCVNPYSDFDAISTPPCASPSGGQWRMLLRQPNVGYRLRP
jgi:hypothetical protein